MPEIGPVMVQAVQMRASDVLLLPGQPPVARIDGVLRKMELPAVDAAECKRMIYSILTPAQTAQFEKQKELDGAFSLAGVARFRFNVFVQANGVACALRALNSKIPTPQEVGLGKEIIGLAGLSRGLVLVTGPAGSGKTTTLAAMVQHVIVGARKHILTIEDPIEYVFKSEQSVVNQREVGVHTDSFSKGLRAALRENPDIVLIGEMRDRETVELAIKAAETGHLCLSTLHTRNAPSTIDRIVSEFPTDQQERVRLQLAEVLAGVVSQALIPQQGGGRVCAREVMLRSSGICSLIREGKLHQILGQIEAGRQEGMQSMDQSLAALVAQGAVEFEMACSKAHDPVNLRQVLHSMGIYPTAATGVAQYVAPTA